MKTDCASFFPANLARPVRRALRIQVCLLPIGMFGLAFLDSEYGSPQAAVAQEPTASVSGDLATNDPNRGPRPPSAPSALLRDGLVVPSAPVDAELESSLTGHTVRLASLRDRVRVVFYEDKDHIAQNEQLKGTLGRFIADNQLESELALLPIANADGFRFEPAASLVRAGLAEAARRIHLDILIDWNRRLYDEPFSLSSGASCVVVIDRDGRIVFRHVGEVQAAQQTALFRAIRRTLRAAR